MRKKEKGITLISLVITIIVIIILAGIGINLSIGENGLFSKAKYAKEETNKQTATEKINLKITTAQINTYSEKQQMPTLKELSLALNSDKEIEYVTEKSQIASTKYEVGEEPISIFTKLKEYNYEFEINSYLQLASIDGIKISKEETITIPKEEYEGLKSTINQIRAGQITVGSINGSTSKTINVVFAEPMKDTNYSVAITQLTANKYFANTQFAVTDKGINGFTILGFNLAGSQTGHLIVNYIVVPYTE